MRLTNKGIVSLILLVAVALRFYKYFEIPFTHDEFSALFRLDFSSFSELIDKGVKIDGHPAGVQVFLYYYTNIFGTEEWVVKLPFTLSGICAVYLVYDIGKKWFNETVGVISAAYMASIQFAVMYSQIARPYISGLFFSLLTVYFWSNLVRSPERNFNRNWILFVVSAALCAYNHHFSLLFSAIVGLSGIFLIPGKYRLKYSIAGLAVFALYIPHLNIFFFQLGIGGVEAWLDKPQSDFIFQHLFYAFNYSIPVMLITIGLAGFGWKNLAKNKRAMRWAILGLVWFLLPLSIGFYYSKYQSAVLQHSVLIFSFPFLLFALFGMIKEQNPKTNLAIVVLILFANTYALIEGRKHYDLFYHSIYEQILVDAESVNDKNVQTTFLIHSNPLITDYYTKELGMSGNHLISIDSFQNELELTRFLEGESELTDQLYLGTLSSIPPNVIPMIRECFPDIETQKNYVGGTTYVFSKCEGAENQTIEILTFDSIQSTNWKPLRPLQILSDTKGQRSNVYSVPSHHEWGPTFTVPLADVVQNKNNFIDISVDFKSQRSLEGVFIVADIKANGKTVHWAATELSTFDVPEKGLGSWRKAYHSVKLADIRHNRNDLMLRIFIWNKSKRNLFIDNMEISLREGNPVIYGLFEKI
ncbi:MAG TPA: glycosyltransferase family 39 protein [Cryomorphaceae bacterium]|nr:glycosyltransferase family 39 protein [Cryomorphaceae bacterium]